MISISLGDFVATGMFGPIQLGMTRSEIEELIAPPALWGIERRRDIATIWRYGEIEFYFLDHRLRMIFTDHDSLTNCGGTCEIDPWLIRPGLRRNEFEAALQAGNIGFEVSQPAYDTRQRLVLTSTSVEFAFLEDTDPECPGEQLGLFSWNHRVHTNGA
jgi:hypothetical protein